MVQNRLIGASFLLAMSASLAGFPPAHQRGTEMRSLLDDLSPAASLKEFAAASRDFRGCDGGWNHVDDFWAFDVKGLYELKAVEPVEARANDRTGCHVNDFWSANIVGFYTLADVAVSDPNDPAIKLIELSIAAADEEDP